MDQRQLLTQSISVSPQTIITAQLLQVTSLNLEEVIRDELSQNPALEAITHCPTCGRRLENNWCQRCGTGLWYNPPETAFTFLPAAPGGGDRGNSVDEINAQSTSLQNYLLWQIQQASITIERDIAEFVIYSLDEKGFLPADLEIQAMSQGFDEDEIARAISLIQQLDPPGIGARDLPECLSIQIMHLEQQNNSSDPTYRLALRIIREGWELLANQEYGALASRLGTSKKNIETAVTFISQNLYPYPTALSWDETRMTPDQSNDTLRPDVIFERQLINGKQGIRAVVPYQPHRWLTLSSNFHSLNEKKQLQPALREDEERWIETRLRNAEQFMAALSFRCSTLQVIADALADIQQPFILADDAHLEPLTRRELAEQLHYHESTISRAVAGKYALLPSQKIVPLAVFFDNAWHIKQEIRQLIAHEDKPLSDLDIALALQSKGVNLGRRVVTKYRNAMKIPPSNIRARQQRRSGQGSSRAGI